MHKVPSFANNYNMLLCNRISVKKSQKSILKGVFNMLFRSCAGGVVFSEDNKVFLLKNENGEWVLPKGVMKKGDIPSEVALQKLRDEAGLSVEIISPAGRTNYEFYSVSRQKPVCNKIIWYIMKSLDKNIKCDENGNAAKGSFFPLEEAINLINCKQDKSLLHLFYKKYKELA